MRVFVTEALQDKVTLGVLRLQDLSMPEDDGAGLWAEIERVAAAISTTNAGKSVGQVSGVQGARQLYRSIGLDPTKTRPSSEALLRRVLKGKPLYHIHPLVDLFNLVSLETLTPIGLYDETRIDGDTVNIRIGIEGEGYEGIRKGHVNLTGRFLVADKSGPFGSPTSDSLRTAIDGPVTDALVIFFHPSGTPNEMVVQAMDRATALAQQHLNARIRAKTVISH